MLFTKCRPLGNNSLNYLLAPFFALVKCLSNKTGIRKSVAQWSRHPTVALKVVGSSPTKVKHFSVAHSSYSPTRLASVGFHG